MVHFLEKLSNPKSVAIYGANNDFLGTMGTIQMLVLLDTGYKGKIYPIHLKEEKVLNIPAYKSISEIPEIPDLALITLPTKVVPHVLEEIGKKGVKSAVIVSAGFRESENKEGEIQIKKIADKYGIRFIGPNCLGMINTHSKINGEKNIFNYLGRTYSGKPGNVSIAAQSGTFACHSFFILKERGLYLSKSFSVGNEANIDICDCLEYLGEDPTTDVICLYIEEIKRGRKFIELAKKITPKKPIIAIYVGGTEISSRVIASHTGSIAGNDEIFNAVFDQSGVIRVYSMEEMFDTASLMSKYIPQNVFPKGKKLAIVTNSGGTAATMTDQASRLGLEIPIFSVDLKKELEKILPSTAAISNPVDLSFVIQPQFLLHKIPKIINATGEVDGYICYGVFTEQLFALQEFGENYLKNDMIYQKSIEMFMNSTKDFIKKLKDFPKKYGVPMVFINLFGLDDSIFEDLNNNNLPAFKMPHQAVTAMNNFMLYAEFRRRCEIKN
ncbi:MAG: CoA-binding protein [archaeon]|nr:CoA-binding protein [archaeon]